MKAGTTTLPDRKTSADLLIQRIVRHAYLGTIQDMTTLLLDGPTWPNPSQLDLDSHRWFLELDEVGRRQVLRLIGEVSYAAIFHALNIFDGTVSTLVPGKITELVIQLQLFDNVAAARSGMPTHIVDINPPDELTEDLHDLFQEAVRKVRLQH